MIGEVGLGYWALGLENRVSRDECFSKSRAAYENGGYDTIVRKR